MRTNRKLRLESLERREVFSVTGFEADAFVAGAETASHEIEQDIVAIEAGIPDANGPGCLGPGALGFFENWEFPELNSPEW